MCVVREHAVVLSLNRINRRVQVQSLLGQPIILRSESIVATLEGDLLDSLHQSNLIISECCFLYRAWGFSGDSITDVIKS